MKKRTTILGIAFAFLLCVGLTACGSDDDDKAATDDTVTTQATDPAVDVVEVTAVDFDFEDLPDSVPAGTKLMMRNDAETELHELVAFRLPDDETRSLEEIIQLDQDEMQKVLGPPTTVILAPPMEEQVATPVGDGTLSEPGRYAIVCFIPTGVDPDAYLDAAASGEQPDLDGGPPHFVHGMYAELEVT